MEDRSGIKERDVIVGKRTFIDHLAVVEIVGEGSLSRKREEGASMKERREGRKVAS